MSKDEGGRMRDEIKAACIHFILHPSAFILALVHPAAAGLHQTPLRGVTLRH
jgi:cytochrome b561